MILSISGKINLRCQKEHTNLKKEKEEKHMDGLRDLTLLLKTEERRVDINSQFLTKLEIEMIATSVKTNAISQ
jgi:hypothetical protein